MIYVEQGDFQKERNSSSLYSTVVGHARNDDAHPRPNLQFASQPILTHGVDYDVRNHNSMQHLPMFAVWGQQNNLT
jgi:hypothetical protein